MLRLHFGRLWPIHALILAVFLTACQPKAIPMTPAETQRIEGLTSQMSTRCVGRYLIDMPVSFVLNSESSTEIEGVAIMVRPMDKLMFVRMLDEREMSLRRQMQPGPDRNRPHLRKTISIREPSLGLVFDRAESIVSSDRSGRELELMAWREGYHIQASIKATDLTFPEDADDSIAQQLKTDVDKKLAHLLDVYERISGRKDTEVPTEQGVCFANGFLKGPPTDHEVILIQHHLDQSPDVSTAFHSLSDLVQSDSLLDRGASIEAMLKDTGGRTLRKGPARSQMPDAQEWLMSKRDVDSGLMYQHLTMEVNATTGSPATPVVVFDLDAGVPIPAPPQTLEQAAISEALKKTTLSEPGAIALWDAITATLRRRPGAF
jgi:hypothetical protein